MSFCQLSQNIKLIIFAILHALDSLKTLFELFTHAKYSYCDSEVGGKIKYCVQKRKTLGGQHPKLQFIICLENLAIIHISSSILHST